MTTRRAAKKAVQSTDGRALPTLPARARVAGTHSTARELLAACAQLLAGLEIVAGEPALPLDDDYAQVEMALDRAPAPPALPVEPEPDTSYAGLSPDQRAALLHWAGAPAADSPAAFRRLWLAWMECGLLEALLRADTALLRTLTLELAQLESPAWKRSESLARTQFFALRLLGDALAWAQWIGHGHPHAKIMGLALGQQALAGQPLTPAEALVLARAWKIIPAHEPLPSEAVLALRLETLTQALGTHPLAAALARAGESAREPLAWRCAHRDLRLAFAQPDIHAALEPLIAELFAVTVEEREQSVAAAPSPTVEAEEPAAAKSAKREKWTLVLEFGDSRSEYFEFALHQAQKLPGYAVLLDEQRHIVYRVVFGRSEIRRFWALWDYVQNWANTRVFVNGQELERWKIWPYSYYMNL